MNCNYKVKITDIQTKYKFKVFCTGYDDSEIKEKIDAMYQAWPKATAEGETPTLDNTANATMSIDLKGNTSQETTTGKNLFNIEGQYETGTGITFTKNNDGSYTLNGTANGNNFLRGLCYLNEQHTISYSSSTANSNVIIRTRTGTPTAQTGIQDQLAVSTTSGNLTSSKQFDFVEISIVSGTTLNDFKIYIQLEKGSSVTTFEPYTNGASPNPDYPQDVHVVTGDNTITINENLFDEIYTDINNNLSYKPINVGVGSFTLKTTAPLNNLNNANLFLLAGNVTTGANTSENGVSKGTPRTQNSVNGYITIAYRNLNGTNPQDYKTELYNTNHIQTYSINLGTMELCKIGGYQDYIYKDNKKWYKYETIGKVILDGTETWTGLNAGGGGYKRAEHLISNSPSITSPRTIVISNYFKYNDAYATDTIGTCFISESKLFVYPKQQDNFSNFKTWLGTNNTSIYYPLATPTANEITDTTLISQLNALAGAESYTGQTNISQVNNDKPFIITAKALKDLSNL